jgi:hypothetical protein
VQVKRERAARVASSLARVFCFAVRMTRAGQSARLPLRAYASAAALIAEAVGRLSRPQFPRTERYGARILLAPTAILGAAVSGSPGGAFWGSEHVFSLHSKL